jgi:hypothetical protein
MLNLIFVSQIEGIKDPNYLLTVLTNIQSIGQKKNIYFIFSVASETSLSRWKKSLLRPDAML